MLQCYQNDGRHSSGSTDSPEGMTNPRQAVKCEARNPCCKYRKTRSAEGTTDTGSVAPSGFPKRYYKRIPLRPITGCRGKEYKE